MVWNLDPYTVAQVELWHRGLMSRVWVQAGSQRRSLASSISTKKWGSRWICPLSKHNTNTHSLRSIAKNTAPILCPSMPAGLQQLWLGQSLWLPLAMLQWQRSPTSRLSLVLLCKVWGKLLIINSLCGDLVRQVRWKCIETSLLQTR